MVLKFNFLSLRKFTETLAPMLENNGSIVNMASLAGFGWWENIDVVNKGLLVTKGAVIARIPASVLMDEREKAVERARPAEKR